MVGRLANRKNTPSYSLQFCWFTSFRLRVIALPTQSTISKHQQQTQQKKQQQKNKEKQYPTIEQPDHTKVGMQLAKLLFTYLLATRTASYAHRKSSADILFPSLGNADMSTIEACKWEIAHKLQNL